jgi:hypothetical protein
MDEGRQNPRAKSGARDIQMRGAVWSAFFPPEGIRKVLERTRKEFGRNWKEFGRFAPGFRPVPSFFGPFPSALRREEKK